MWHWNGKPHQKNLLLNDTPFLADRSTWKRHKGSIDSFASTSVFRDTAYSGEVEMTILVPQGVPGACYVNDISHHHLTKGFEDEYEVILQRSAEYSIMEAQYFDGKLFLCVEYKGKSNE